MRNALITGSSGGLGLAIAQRLAEDGWRVAINSRNSDRAASVATALVERRLAAVDVAGDVARPDSARKLVADAIEKLGHLDLLVNNAGIAAEAPSAEFPFHVWTDILATNLTGSFICAREAGAHMLGRGGGTIVNMGSMWALFGMPQRAAYATSKHGVHGLTTALAREWGGRGVRTVSLDPGYIRTGMVDNGSGDGLAHLVDRTPLGRLGTPEEVADAVAFLAHTALVQGNGLAVDGGWSAYGGW